MRICIQNVKYIDDDSIIWIDNKFCFNANHKIFGFIENALILLLSDISLSVFI